MSAVQDGPQRGGTPGLVVVKLGGRTQDDPALAGALARAWRAAGGRLVVVHGGGDQVSALPVAGVRAPALLVTAAIDNLTKGAAGQAVQNANLMLGLDETAGLPR